MLSQEDPGTPFDYGCTLYKLAQDAFGLFKDFQSLVLEPFSARSDGRNSLIFCYRGFVFFYRISKHGITDTDRHFVLNEAGVLQIFETDVRNFPLIGGLLDRGIKTAREWPG